MRVGCKKVCLVFVAVTLLAVVAISLLSYARAEDGSSWFSNETPTLSKVVELGGNVQPDSHNVDCATSDYTLPDASIRRVCTFLSPLGTITSEGDLQTGLNKYTTLYGPDSLGGFLPEPDPNTAVVAFRSPQIGNNLGIYHHLSKSSLKKVGGDYRTYYYVPTMPDAILRNPVTHVPLAVSTPGVTYSANGKWMVVNVPQAGLLRVNLEDMSTKLFARPLEPSWFLGLDSPPLAITNDGMYVAANTGLFGASTLNIYDLSTCDDQLNVAVDNHWCSGRNILQGQTLIGQPTGGGLTDQMADLQSPVQLRFVDDQTLSFYAKYDVHSASVYKVANFVATAPGGVQHKLGLLGLGDSYISGQGAFDYRSGTDTSINPCHLSLISYPFILGRQSFDSFNSIACSGATSNNVIGSNPKYRGQVKDELAEDQRDGSSILSSFMPGYIYQQEFASTYKPEAMLLSVGGDDIGFADIVKSCVANADTCYSTYEDRAELVNEINNTYGKLVNTYQTLREQSGGGRLYVVGYPQVAKVGGDCALNVHLNSEEVAFSAQLISYLDSVVQRAAQTAGVFYVDTQHAFDGHRLCEAGSAAMNGLTAGNDAGIVVRNKPLNFIGAESYHPTQRGYQLLANTIAQKTANLTAPMPNPTQFEVPSFDRTTDMLQGVQATGRKVNWVTDDDTISNDFVLRGDTQQVTVNGQTVQLQPGSKYQVVLHSDPILLDEGGVDTAGNISVTVRIPADVAPGYHTLHVYGTNMAGDGVDIQKHIFVAASEDDYLGTGLSKGCLVVPASGQDADHDGVDDACDPEVISHATASANVSGQISASGEVASNQVIAHSSLSTSSTVSQQTGANKVLGETVTAAQPKSQLNRPAIETQRLYSVDWLKTAEIGLGITLVISLFTYALKQKT